VLQNSRDQMSREDLAVQDLVRQSSIKKDVQEYRVVPDHSHIHGFNGFQMFRELWNIQVARRKNPCEQWSIRIFWLSKLGLLHLGIWVGIYLHRLDYIRIAGTKFYSHISVFILRPRFLEYRFMLRLLGSGNCTRRYWNRRIQLKSPGQSNKSPRKHDDLKQWRERINSRPERVFAYHREPSPQ